MFVSLSDAQIRLPALTDQQGPPFYAPAEDELGLTAVGFWDDVIESDDEDRHFECLAGQAVYNPNSHNGVRRPRLPQAPYANARIFYRHTLLFRQPETKPDPLSSFQT
eukprot:scaffold174276_cov22-Prasinocladus_malaysianus.AAC.1